MRSKPNVVLTLEIMSEASTVLVVVMIVSALALPHTVVLVKVSVNKAAFLTLEVTISSMRADIMSDLVSLIATPTDVSKALVLVKLFQVERDKVMSTVAMEATVAVMETATVAASVATVATDIEDTEYF